MNKIITNIFVSANTFAIRISRGRLGSQLGTQSVLLLHSRGRKSGQRHITPIAYFQLEGYFFLVGSNWGKAQNAGWYYNLLAEPHATIEIKGKPLTVIARKVEGKEYERLWNYAIQHHPPYQHYKEMTKRHIPIMLLQPVD